MNKTICFVNAHFFPLLGGITRYIDNLIKDLQKRGFHIIMVTQNFANLAEVEEADGIKIYRLPCINLMDGRFPIIKLNKRCREMLKEIAAYPIDLMIINARFYILSLYMARFAERNSIRSIVIDHGSSHLTMGSHIMTKLGEWYEHCITMMLKHYCKDFYGVSKASCEWIKHFGIAAKGALYNAVDVKQIEEMKKNPVGDYRKQYNLSEDSCIVVYTGRLVIEKGVLQIIEAVKQIRVSHNNVYLMIAGEGPLMEQIRSSLPEGVFLLGQLSLHEIVSLLQQSKVLLLPSKSEGFPTSVLEAVACKCFVAATKVGGATEIIPTEEYGILLEQNDEKHIREAIEYVLTHEKDVLAAVNKSYERMLQNFTWEKTGEKIYKIVMSEER